MKARVYDYYKSQEQSEYDENRKSAVGTGDRSERIRTYNYPQNRVTDHRIGLSLNKLDRIMNGELDDVIDALVLYDQTKALEELLFLLLMITEWNAARSTCCFAVRWTGTLRIC